MTRLKEQQDQSLVTERREVLRPLTVRPMTTDDYSAWMAVAGDPEHGAWPGFHANEEHDFVAMVKGTVTSPAVFEGDRMVGGSLNLVKHDPDEGVLYLLTHMVGVDRRMQGRGVGNELMKANYRLITNGILPEAVDEIRLTSDSLETANVRYYMHKNGMSVAEYVPDVYKNLAAGGGEQHRGLPADRFLYRARPESEWIQRRVLPNDLDYQAALAGTPESLIAFADFANGTAVIAGTPVAFIETPKNIGEVKTRSMEEARRWRQYQAETCNALFARGYTAVDHSVGKEWQNDRIILMQGFNPSDPECLVRALGSFRG